MANSSIVNDWKILLDEIKRRFELAPFNAPLMAYVFCAIIILGGAGIWFQVARVLLPSNETIYPRYDGIFTAIMTFYPALMGSATFYLLLSSWSASKSEDAKTARLGKILVATAYSMAILAFGSAILLASIYPNFAIFCFAFAVLCIIMSIVFWIFVHSEEPPFKLPEDSGLMAVGANQGYLEGDDSDKSAAVAVDTQTTPKMNYGGFKTE